MYLLRMKRVAWFYGLGNLKKSEVLHFKHWVEGLLQICGYGVGRTLVTPLPPTGCVRKGTTFSCLKTLLKCDLTGLTNEVCRISQTILGIETQSPSIC